MFCLPKEKSCQKEWGYTLVSFDEVRCILSEGVLLQACVHNKRMKQCQKIMKQTDLFVLSS